MAKAAAADPPSSWVGTTAGEWLRGLDAERARRAVLWVVGLGLLTRVVLAFSTYGFGFDMDSVLLVRDRLSADWLGAYSSLNVPIEGPSFDTSYRWPYPPAFFGWVWVADQLSGLAGPYHGWVQLPTILADAVLALIAFDFLRRRGYAPGWQLTGGAIVMLAPPMLLTSGYHGQIDSLAFLPAVLALYLWDRDDIWRGRSALLRPATIGALIGLAASIKLVPIILLAAFFPHVWRSPRRALALVAPAVAIPLAMFLPFLIADADGVLRALSYSARPGAAGLSMMLQPEIVEYRLGGAFGSVELTSTSSFLLDHGSKMAIVGLAIASLFLVRFRPPPLLGACLLVLAFYVASPSLYLHYAVWLIPVAVMAGYLRESALIGAWMLIPAAIAYWIQDPGYAAVYVFMVAALWLGFVALAVVVVRRVAGPARGRLPEPLAG